MYRFLAVAFVFAATSSIKADTCGSNCLSSNCPTCPCGNTTNYATPTSYCEKYTNWDIQCCKCIILAESHGNANTMTFNDDESWNIGLFQINENMFDACNKGQYPCDPQQNLACARKLWQLGGKSFKYWPSVKKCTDKLKRQCHQEIKTSNVAK